MATTATVPSIAVHNVTKHFTRQQGTEVTRLQVLRSVSLTVADQEFVSLIGPSGCGKTTLLRIIAGLLPSDGGVTEVYGQPVTGPGPERGMVFQSGGLLPWRTVVQNVELGLELQKMPPAQRRERAVRYARLVGLERFLNFYPHELSGGMQQRVGLARALAIEPRILLMDEPFGALDAITRAHLQDELLRIWEQERRTVVFVTHSVDEALLLSDRIVVMGKDGRIIDELKVPIPRPRSRDQLLFDRQYLELQQYLISKLYSHEEV